MEEQGQSLDSLQRVENDIIHIIETVADLFTKLTVEGVVASDVDSLITEYGLLLKSVNETLATEISKYIQFIPVANSNCKAKLDRQITDLTIAHIHEQIKDMKSVIEEHENKESEKLL